MPRWQWRIKGFEKQKNQLTKEIDTLIELQLKIGVSDRLIVKMKQLEAQLNLVTERIDSMKDDDPNNNELAWVDSFLKQSEDLIAINFNFGNKTNEDKNLFFKKYIKAVTMLDGEITNIEYSEDVQRLIHIQEDGGNNSADKNLELRDVVK